MIIICERQIQTFAYIHRAYGRMVHNEDEIQIIRIMIIDRCYCLSQLATYISLTANRQFLAIGYSHMAIVILDA